MAKHKTETEYDVSLHWKQGDEFHDLLEEANEDVKKAFELWAELFAERRKVCLEIAEALKGVRVSAEANNHFIGLQPDNREAAIVLDKLVDDGLINSHEEEFLDPSEEELNFDDEKFYTPLDDED